MQDRDPYEGLILAAHDLLGCMALAGAVLLLGLIAFWVVWWHV